MDILQVLLFGKLEIRCGERILPGLEARRVQELLCYLVLNRDRSHPREVLIDLLWGDTPATRSRGYLRKALWQLQSALDNRAKSGHSPVLLVEADFVQFNPESDLWIDVAEYEQTFNLVQGVRGKDLNTHHIESVQKAVNLYRGDLLEGWYQSWCLYERERLQYIYLVLLDKLMDYCESHYQYEAGIAYGIRALRYDPAREWTHRRLMRLQYRAGDRTGALRQFERCVAVLAEELGVTPTQQTVDLCEKIQADTLDDLNLAQSGGDNFFPEILSHLEYVQLALASLQHNIKQDIQRLKQFMQTTR